MPTVLFVCLPVGRIRSSAPTERCLPVPKHDAEPVLQALSFGSRPEDPEAVASIPLHLTSAALSEMQLMSECRSLDISARGPTTKAFTLPYSLSLLAMGPSRGLLRS